MVALTFTLTHDAITPELARLKRAAADLSPAMAAIAAYMLSEAQQRFEDQKGPDGTPWKPSQRVREQGGQTLVLSGQLVDSLISANDATSATVGTNKVYAGIHNQGGTINAIPKSAGGKGALRTPFGPRASVTMPRRQFIGFAPDDGDEIRAILLDHFARAA